MSNLTIVALRFTLYALRFTLYALRFTLYALRFTLSLHTTKPCSLPNKIANVNYELRTTKYDM
jgi:hypothetical protein